MSRGFAECCVERRGRTAAETWEALERAADRAGASGGIDNQILLWSGAVYQRKESLVYFLLNIWQIRKNNQSLVNSVRD